MKLIFVILLSSLFIASCFQQNNAIDYDTIEVGERISSIDLDYAFSFVGLTPSIKYYPASMKKRTWNKDEMVKHTKVNIPKGASRIGGPVVDFPEEVEFPINYAFIAQVNLAKCTAFDKDQRLPSSGQLYFFVDTFYNHGLVLYAKDAPLKRYIIKNQGDFICGSLVEHTGGQDRYMDRFDHETDDWLHLAGRETSKLLGIQSSLDYPDLYTYSHKRSNDKIQLLQIGTDFLKSNKILSVYIQEEQLVETDFTSCSFVWTSMTPEEMAEVSLSIKK